MTNNSVRVGHLTQKPNLFHVVIGSILAVTILLTNFQLIHVLDAAAFASIGFFNFLFVFLLFPLDGTLRHKIVLLIAGNLVGVIWHFLVLSLENSFYLFTTGIFEMIFLVIVPLTNFMWIVTMWSVSLSVLAADKRKTQKLETH